MFGFREQSYLDDITLHLRIAMMRGHLDRARTVFDADDHRVAILENRIASYEQQEALRRSLAS